MRIKNGMVLVAVSLLVGLSGGAQENEKKKEDSSPQQQKAEELTGTVVKTSGQTLYVRKDDKVVSVRITSKTRFEGSRTKLRDFQPGERVRVAFARTGGQKVARTVSLESEALEGLGGSGKPSSPSETMGPYRPLDEESGTGGSGMMNYEVEKNTWNPITAPRPEE